jgi:hypothetical protein
MVLFKVLTKSFFFFSKYAPLKNERKNNITLEHLLTMISGLQWNEWDVPISDERNDMVVASTGGNYVDKDPVNEIVAHYIIPSM